MTRCYEIMRDLPTVPREYVDLAFRTVEESQVPPQNPFNERHIIKNNKVSASRANPRFDLEKHMSDWVNTHISCEWLQISVANSVPDQYIGNGNDTIHGPHTDTTRQYTLMYLLAVGNTDQTTVFYQEPGFGVRRKRKLFPRDIDKLIKIDSIVMPLHTWVYFDTSIIHSVENIQSVRTAIQISFDCEPFGIFVRD